MIASSNSIFYSDEYEQQYQVDWETVNGNIDITTIIRTPFIIGEEPQGFVKNGVLFRKGMISVRRQIIRYIQDGYEIVAEGQSHFEDYIQMNFPCEKGPSDPFLHHLDSSVSDEVEFIVIDGPHWANPDDSTDDVVWGDLDANGIPVGVVTGDVLSWVDPFG